MQEFIAQKVELESRGWVVLFWSEWLWLGGQRFEVPGKAVPMELSRLRAAPSQFPYLKLLDFPSSKHQHAQDEDNNPRNKLIMLMMLKVEEVKVKSPRKNRCLLLCSV
jgi:hypothetical protein